LEEIKRPSNRIDFLLGGLFLFNLLGAYFLFFFLDSCFDNYLKFFQGLQSKIVVVDR
jgi:hypothetical protein